MDRHSKSTSKAEFIPTLKPNPSANANTSPDGGVRRVNRRADGRLPALGLLTLSLAIGLKGAAADVETVATFGNPLQAAQSPIGAPVRGAGGTYLGLASASGAGDGQPLFQVNPDGTAFHLIRRIEDANWLSAGASNRVYVTTGTKLWSFNDSGNDPRLLHTFETSQPAGGLMPSFGVVDDATGWLYGMTLQGGTAQLGVVYRIRADGTGFSVIHSFEGYPYGTPGRLRMDRLGRLYGFQDQGILSVGFGHPLIGKSSMFVLSVEGSMTRLVDWDFWIVDVVEGRDSAFHALAGPRYFSSISPAQLFRIPTGTGSPEVEFTFASQPGGVTDPNPGLGVDPSGRIIGTARQSLSSQPTPDHQGGVFTFDPSMKAYSILTQFPFSQTNSIQRPLEGPAWIDGAWVGFTSGFLDGGMYRISPGATNYSGVHVFSLTGGGFTPRDSPLINPDGSVLVGGIEAPTGGFEIASWRPDDPTVHTVFPATDAGAVLSGKAPPYGHLTRVADGTIYHLGTVDGANDTSIAISKVSADGTQLTRIATRANLFSSDESLLQVADGSVYGTSIYGGSADNGALFRLTPGAGIQVLFSFGIEGISGKNPHGGVVEASDGLLYGITASPKSINGGATFFRIRKDGTRFEELGGGGANATSGLTLASDGNLYGLVQGFISQVPTAIVRVAIPSGAVSQVTALPLGAGAQAYPSGSVTEGLDGRLYVLTEGNRSEDRGIVFSIERDGSDGRTEHQFSGAEACTPAGSLRVGPDGNLYGITTQGGPAGAGALFRLPATPRLSVERKTTGSTLKTRLRVGARARFESASTPAGPWTPHGATLTSDATGQLSTAITPAAAQQFYRLVLE